MTSAEIRQSFLDFFASKGHTIVPSSSLMPDSPNLLFTNAGMNQFVPIFLGQRPPDVSKWAGAIPAKDTRAADTQKCIRAGGKHNDLEDVGLDTYHHTFFEMLGNWSFGDYFKKEAIEWAWELLVTTWQFPPERLYATVFCPAPYMHRWAEEMDAAIKQVEIGPTVAQEDVPLTGGATKLPDRAAIQHWIRIFRRANLDPREHIVPGSLKDNFWMMGDTGPCGPCSELHVDLTPAGDTKGSLVNQGDARCIEIWNLVFIQFNANPDGTFSPLPAKHVDTGMGFERVTGIIQCTKGFTDFNRTISNYETDIFRPIFDALEKMSDKKYASTLPPSDLSTINSQQSTDIAFRVIADHIRTLSFAIADGIQPGNNDRNYVLRRILRRAVRYGRTLDFHEPFFYKLVNVLAQTMGHVFPEIRARHDHVEEVIQREEEAFNKTLEVGLCVFDEVTDCVAYLQKRVGPLQEAFDRQKAGDSTAVRLLKDDHGLRGPSESIRLAQVGGDGLQRSIGQRIDRLARLSELNMDEAGAVLRDFQQVRARISGESAFLLYDTYGFPLDLTELMARERGLTVDVAGFNKLMEEQRARARSAQKKEVVSLSQIETTVPTRFVGFDKLEAPAKVLEAIGVKDKTAIVLDTSPFYAEMGGQVGDTGELSGGGHVWRVANTQKTGNVWLHFLEASSHASRITDQVEARDDVPTTNSTVTLSVDRPRRFAIQRHHTVTHLLHWALHEVVSKDATQKGSFVGPDKLTFDFNSAPLAPAQAADIEKLVNERILENAPVSWTEVAYNQVKDRKDIMQFFGDKYGDVVRVVQIGGKPTALDGYSMELCGGTHTRATGEIGLFRIVAESAIAAGVRRIEAVAGLEAYARANEELRLIRTVAGKVNSPVAELEKKIEALLAQQKELEKRLKAGQQKQAADAARGLAAKARTVGAARAIVENLGVADGDFLQSIADALKGQFEGVVVLGGSADGAVSLVATVSPGLVKQFQAGKIIQAIAPLVGGKGGGRPDNARGGGKDVTKLDEALTKATELLAESASKKP